MCENFQLKMNFVIKTFQTSKLIIKRKKTMKTNYDKDILVR